MNSSNNSRVNAIELIKVIAIISMINIHVFDSNSYNLTDIGSGLGHFIYAVVYICGGVISAGLGEVLDGDSKFEIKCFYNLK